MNKRGFLRSLLGTVAGLAVAQRTVATPGTRHLLLQSSPLAGFQFHAGQNIWNELRVGAALTMQRELQNRHDGRAVAILWNGLKLGYIPRNENTAIAQLLDRGERLVGHIEELKESQNPWDRVRVVVAHVG